MIITPREFLRAFEKTIAQNTGALVSNWLSNSTYTSLWKKPGSGIYFQLADKMGLSAISEYWSLDAVFFKTLDKTIHNGNYAKNLWVVMEHENSGRDSIQEMNKLSIIDSPLKVLVTYAESEGERQSLLGKYKEILSESDTFGDLGSQRKHLVVFGELKGDVIKWHPRLFNGTGFSAIGG